MIGPNKEKSPFDFNNLNLNFDAIFETFDLTAFDFGGTGTPNTPNVATPPRAPSTPDASHSSNNNSTGSTQSTNQTAPLISNPSRQGIKALAIAQQEIGVKEQPKGSNRGPRVDQYQNGKGQYWCCHFVSWCFEQTGSSPFGHKGWVEGLRRWAKSHNSYTPSSQAIPQAGDIFTMARYDKAGQLAGGHTGFVKNYNTKSKMITTIEGNASDSVMQRTRPLNSLDGIIRV